MASQQLLEVGRGGGGGGGFPALQTRVSLLAFTIVKVVMIDRQQIIIAPPSIPKIPTSADRRPLKCDCRFNLSLNTVIKKNWSRYQRHLYMCCC